MIRDQILSGSDGSSPSAGDGVRAELVRRREDIARRIVELARRWYRYGNESELAEAVCDYELVVGAIDRLDGPKGSVVTQD